MSRSRSKSGAYHHGDLRNTLIDVGTKMLAEVGEQALSMRKLAKEAGVSHNAPYMHFADKEALLAAIAEEGFAILGTAVSDAVPQHDDWHEKLHRGCWAYVEFALAHPSHMQVMFRAYDPEKYPSLSQTSLSALGILGQLIENGQDKQLVQQKESQLVATFVWSLLHGIATILANGKMPQAVIGNTTPEKLVEQYVTMLYEGLSTKS